MKAIQQLLIRITLLSLLNILALNIYAMPEAQMHSTSAMLGAGSSLPQAAVTGTTTTYDTSARTITGPKRVLEEDDKEDKEDDGWNEPGVPMGDAYLPLILLAAAYAAYIAYRKTRAKS